MFSTYTTPYLWTITLKRLRWRWRLMKQRMRWRLMSVLVKVLICQGLSITTFDLITHKSNSSLSSIIILVLKGYTRFIQIISNTLWKRVPLYKCCTFDTFLLFFFLSVTNMKMMITRRILIQSQNEPVRVSADVKKRHSWCQYLNLCGEEQSRGLTRHSIVYNFHVQVEANKSNRVRNAEILTAEVGLACDWAS